MFLPLRAGTKAIQLNQTSGGICSEAEQRTATRRTLDWVAGWLCILDLNNQTNERTHINVSSGLQHDFYLPFHLLQHTFNAHFRIFEMCIFLCRWHLMWFDYCENFVALACGPCFLRFSLLFSYDLRFHSPITLRTSVSALMKNDWMRWKKKTSADDKMWCLKMLSHCVCVWVRMPKKRVRILWKMWWISLNFSHWHASRTMRRSIGAHSEWQCK